MKVAIVGLGPSTHDKAPWDTDWEVWGTPQDRDGWLKCSRLFEMHPRDGLAERTKIADYVDRLKMVDVPIYMQRAWLDIPASIGYPFENVARNVFKGFPRWDQDDWYDCSIAYMLALAIHEWSDEIGLWGVDMDDANKDLPRNGARVGYDYQMPNISFLLGVALGRGIKVSIAEGPTKLCKAMNGRYGANGD